ncbi:UDP-N-acetylglucosamine 1-carboxyvinyltransferase [Ignavibacteria bacterium]|nr:UDP-N-acetylglucosamine 1-carboxyvinyltransferase [Bacteroidota bacterium]MCZ2133678.1 UDP-N-acetylglucosamine 1-carboxyvinyltransferase [Bacteroidota bacterium]
MDKFIIEGGRRLVGAVRISGSKNAALAIIPSVLLAPGVFRLRNTPNIRDIWTMSRLLGAMGAHCELNGSELFVDSNGVNSFEAPYEHVKKMRASINVLGPLVARFGRAKVSLPGGCAFGPRPIDLHLKGLEKLGAEIGIENGYIIANAQRLRGARIHFDISSVGATENILSAAVLADGVTTITNAAIEPEVSALAKMLVKMGAKISGIGTATLEIEGVKELHAVEEENLPDRIEAATFLIAAAITQGKIVLENVNPYHLTAVIAKMEEAGCEFDVTGPNISMELNQPPKPIDATTAPYPGFPTDVQAQWVALMLTAQGSCRATDTIYPTRFHHVPELLRLGAHIEVADNTAIIHGGRPLSGASVMSSDLRASASLILAALAAQGRSEILRVYHLDRGYENIEKKLEQLGASIQRVKTEDF